MGDSALPVARARAPVSLWRRLFGRGRDQGTCRHKMRPRYDKTERYPGWVAKLTNDAFHFSGNISFVKQDKTSTYRGEVCVRCGLFVEPTKETK